MPTNSVVNSVGVCVSFGQMELLLFCLHLLNIVKGQWKSGERGKVERGKVERGESRVEKTVKLGN